MNRLTALLTIVCGLVCGFVCPAALAEEPSLHDTILEQDKVLFDAFNSQDVQTFREVFDEDLEFYHDAAGVTDYVQAIEATERLFEADTGLTRTLIADSVSVYPIPDFGAIQVGKHRFCHPENGVVDCGVFDFMHIWKKSGDAWTIVQVVSYGH